MCMSAIGGHALPAVGGYDFDLEEIVADESVLALDPAATTAQRQAGDARRGIASTGDRETVCLRGSVELAPVGAALDAHSANCGVDIDALHAAHVDAKPAVDHSRAGKAMSAAIHRDRQPSVAREPDCAGHVICGGNPRDRCGAPVDHAVEHAPGVIVAGIAGLH